jgi:hypothetical protein
MEKNQKEKRSIMELPGELITQVLIAPTSELMKLIAVIEGEIQARKAEKDVAYKVTFSSSPETKGTVIKQIRIIKGCDLSKALQFYQSGSMICSTENILQRASLSLLGNSGCRVEKQQ